MTRRNSTQRPGLGLLIAVTAAVLGLTGSALIVVLALDGRPIPWEVVIVFIVGSVLTLVIVAVVGWGILGHTDAHTAADSADTSFATHRQLLDDIRHELKTPITIVRGHLELMDPHDSADVAAIRQLGIGELDRMTRLIGDIDMLATIETGTFSMVNVDLSLLTLRVSELVAVIPDHTWTVEQRATGIIRGDRDRLLQAWLALADNAAKYTPAGSTIRIGSAMNSGGVQLWVRDQGPGIPPAARHRIFRRFDRGGGKRAVGGSGLGLAIVDAIAKAHGGYCTIADTPGGGATFTLELSVGTGAAAPVPVRAGDVLMQREALE
ncbi:ATP-binding protein [Microbacterium sp.]|uniref:sensor histidine kinase n=1 Tax=Microbacterium sp. TaxID=51671 RepID=UPI003A83FE1E